MPTWTKKELQVKMSLLYRLLDFSTVFGGMQELKRAADRIMDYYEQLGAYADIEMQGQYKEICQRYTRGVNK